MTGFYSLWNWLSLIINKNKENKGTVQKVKNERHYDEERRSNPLNISNLHLRDCFISFAMTTFWTAPFYFS